jgi:hypothetical protein
MKLTSGIVIRGIRGNGVLFNKEEVDGDDRLMNASVNAVEDSRDRASIATGMGQGNFANGFASSTVEKIKEKGGQVLKSPIKGNENHCVIFGLSLKDANNLFSNREPWTALVKP